MDAAAPPKVKFTTHRNEPRDNNSIKRSSEYLHEQGAQREVVTLPGKPASTQNVLPALDQLIKEPPRRSTTSLKAISDEDAESGDGKGKPSKDAPAGLKKKLGGWFKKGK